MQVFIQRAADELYVDWLTNNVIGDPPREDGVMVASAFGILAATNNITRLFVVFEPKEIPEKEYEVWLVLISDSIK